LPNGLAARPGARIVCQTVWRPVRVPGLFAKRFGSPSGCLDGSSNGLVRPGARTASKFNIRNDIII
jgi:hypothetical protein